MTQVSIVSANFEGASKPPRLRSNFIWTFFGNSIYGAATWLMISVISKLGTKHDLGEYALGLAVTQPIIMLAQLQLRTVQATDAQRQFSFTDYLALRILAITIAVMSICVLTHIAKYNAETAWVVIIVGVGAAIDSISDIVYGLLQQNERMKRISVSMIAKGLLSLLMLGGCQYFTRNIIWAAAGSSFASLVIVVVYDINSARMIYNNPSIGLSERSDIWNLRAVDKKALKRLFVLSLPLGITTMLMVLNTTIPRYFIEHKTGVAELGVFAALSSLIGTLKVVINALGQSASPRLAKYYADCEYAQFRKLLFRFVGLSALLGITVSLVAKLAGVQILRILYKPEYANYVDLFVLLLVAGGISYIGSAVGFAVSATRYFKVQVPSCLIIVGTSALTSWLYIPKFGMYGAAISSIITAIMQVIVSSVVVWYLMVRGRQTVRKDFK